MTRRLYLCGTGMRVSQLTLESLAALKRCSRVFAVSLPGEVLAELKVLLPCVTDAAHQAGPGKILDEDALCKRVLARWLARDEVGVVFLGHPLLYTAAPALMSRCRREGIEVEVLASLSSADAVLAACAPREVMGLAMLNAQDLARGTVRPDPALTNVVVNLFKLDAAGWKRLCAVLRRIYGPARSVSLVEAGTKELKAAIVKLTGLHGAVSSRTSLLLPSRRPR